MPQLAPLGAVLGSFFSTTVIGSLTIGQIAVTAALSGASFLLQSVNQAASAGDQGIKETLQAGIYEERFIYGRALVAGRMFFYECKPPNLYLGLVLADHECDGIEQVLINGVAVTFDGTGAASSSNFINGTTPYVSISTRLGAAGQGLDPILAANFGELASTFKQQGHTCVVLKCYYGSSADDHNKYWSTGLPQILFQVRGRKVFDPRDPTQSSSDSTTWKWSNNPSLCMADWLTSPRGMKRSWSEIDLAYLAASANHDDEGVSLASGSTEKRYTLNGAFTPNADPASTLQSMLTSNLGDVIWSNGTYRFFSGVAKTPVWTLNDDSARGDMAVRVMRDRASLINLVRTLFVSPDREYQTVNGPILQNTTYAAADGESHEMSLSLPFTNSATMAQRIAKIVMERSRYGRQVTRRESLSAMRLEGADIVNIDMGTLPSLGGVFKINKLLLDLQTFELDLVAEEYAAAAYNWDVSMEQPFTISPATLAGVN